MRWGLRHNLPTQIKSLQWMGNTPGRRKKDVITTSLPSPLLC